VALTQARETIYYSATGPGSTSYIATTIVNEVLGIDYEIVTGYTGSSAYILGVIRGDVDAALVNLSAARPYIRSGDLRVLALFGAPSDDPAIPDAAALGVPELGRLKLVRMIGGPPNLPVSVRQTLETALLAALEDPGFTAWLEASGNEVSPAGSRASAQAVREMSTFYESFKHHLN
jgi:tripartite-type tricarboxylate transporter receptor subunit TctC